jgi:hypothetical protein
MAEQPALDVFWFQGFPQQGICLKVDHSQSQILACSPISIDLNQIIGAEWRTCNG